LQSINEKMPMLWRGWQIIASPELARILLAIAVVEAIASPFAGIKCAVCAGATALCSLAITSHASSICLSWVWHHLAALREEVGERNEGIRQPKVVVQ
jgi:hypothetical protein